MKEIPNGFIAICRCGKVVGAMDFNRTDRKEAGEVLGEWLFAGCKVEPRFNAVWSANVELCSCDDQGRQVPPHRSGGGEWVGA